MPRAELPVIVSPTSGDGAGKGAEPRLAALMAGAATTRFYHPASLAELAVVVHAIVGSGAPELAVAGGDGTIHHVVNALGDADVRLVLMPSGSGNDFCRGLGLPTDPTAAATAIGSGRTLRVDLLEVNGRRVCTVAGLGLVADTGVQVGRWLAPGSPWRAIGRMLGSGVYTGAGGVRVLVGPRIAGRAVIRWRMQSEPWQQVEGRFHGLFLANLPTLGAGLRLPVPSRTDDGWFELVRLPETSRLRLVRALARLSRDRPLPPGVLDVVQAREVEIDWPGGSALVGDGEDLGRAEHFRIRVLPRALQVAAP